VDLFIGNFVFNFNAEIAETAGDKMRKNIDISVSSMIPVISVDK